METKPFGTLKVDDVKNTEIVGLDKKQYNPIPVKKTYRHYKPMAILYKRIAIGSGAIILLLAYCLLITLKGNITLQKQIAEKDVNIIMPSNLTVKSK